jgi:hypothetical protein
LHLQQYGFAQGGCRSRELSTNARFLVAARNARRRRSRSEELAGRGAAVNTSQNGMGETRNSSSCSKKDQRATWHAMISWTPATDVNQPAVNGNHAIDGRRPNARDRTHL